MKKIALLLACAAGTLAANAQVSLSGTSYTENFDNIGTALPTGWEVRTGASATALGTTATFNTTATAWNTSSGGFRNSASADGLTATETASNQSAATDRAISLRQTGSVGDPGGAFLVQIANTTGFTDFNLSFKLQSLDSAGSPRVVTWSVDYGFGATPSSFTAATPVGTMTTGGNTFTNNTISVSFGNVLDNNSGPIWIRIVALSSSTGSGARPTTGIDDFNLTWTSGGGPNYHPVVTGVTPANGATGVLPGQNLQIMFNRSVTANAAGNINVKNVTDQTTQSFAATAGNVTVSGNTVGISGVTLAPNKSYFVTFDSAAFDTAGYKSYGIYDTTQWAFTTVNVVNALDETFTGCTNGNMLGSFTQTSVIGSYTWRCSKYGNTDTFAVYMNGGSATKTFGNEDWLISPRIDVSAWNNVYLHFYSKNRYAHGYTTKQVLVSTNYTGTGDPNNAAWTNLNVTLPADSNTWTAVNNTNLTTYKSQNFYIAYKYVTPEDTTVAHAEEWNLDDIRLTPSPVSVFEVTKSNLSFNVLNNPSYNQSCVLNVELPAAQKLTADMVDMNGRVISRFIIDGKPGINNYPLTFNAIPGMYFIRIYNDQLHGVRKLIVE